MSLPPNPDRDSLPFKKRDQRPCSPTQLHQQHDNAATFKAPYPYKSRNEFTKTKPFQPVPRRVSALYQPWIQTHASTRSKPNVLSQFRERNGWAEWSEFSPANLGWDLSPNYQHHGHLIPGRPAFHLGHTHHHHHPSRFMVAEGYPRPGGGGGYGWEQLKTLQDKSLNTERLSNGRNKGPYVKRKERKGEYLPRLDRVSHPSLSIGLLSSPKEVLEVSHESKNFVKPSVSGHCLVRASTVDQSDNTFTSMKEDTPKSSSSSASSAPNRFPWLLPHFVAGSLIELRDGRLRRVEHLQTEDFLLGSLACPDLSLSCCTVQNILPSTSSSSISRLLVLLHNQQSQELVDVYVEYPFFVRGRGWSSCSPHKTARLCGLRCHQLSVGDVCLALTPVSKPRDPPPPPPPPATVEPETPLCPGVSAGPSEEALKASQMQILTETKQPIEGQQKEAESVRRRHCSAP